MGGAVTGAFAPGLTGNGLLLRCGYDNHPGTHRDAWGTFERVAFTSKAVMCFVCCSNKAANTIPMLSCGWH